MAISKLPSDQNDFFLISSQVSIFYIIFLKVGEVFQYGLVKLRSKFLFVIFEVSEVATRVYCILVFLIFRAGCIKQVFYLSLFMLLY